jgi:hypothetical protein
MADDLVKQFTTMANGDNKLAVAVAMDQSINSVRDLALQYDGSKHAALGPSLMSQDPTGVAVGLLKRSQVAGEDEEAKASAATLLSNAKDFNLATDRVQILSTNSEPKNKEALKLLEAIQRVHNVATDPDSASSLLRADYTSAAQIAALSTTEFSQSVPDIPSEIALQIHGNAAAVTSRNELFLASAAPSRQVELDPVARAFQSDSGVEVNLDTLFGESIATDQSNESGTVLSPAAYLLDLLDTLPPSMRDKLMERRPDIAKLALSMGNANTEIPYLDLVNEVMEAVLQKNLSEPFNTGDDVQSAELVAEPHNVNKAVYETLASRTTPIGVLPFDRSLQQARTILGSLGIPRHTILAQFGPNTAQNKRAIFADILGLLESEYIALTGESFTIRPEGQTVADYRKLIGYKDTYSYWGYDVWRAMTDGGSLDYSLHRVKAQFLKRTGYSFSEITQLLNMRFINGETHPALIRSSERLEDLWKKVKWTIDEQKDWVGRWGDLMASLKVDAVASPENARKVTESFLKLPEKIVLTTQSGDRPTFPLSGHIYFSTDEKSIKDEDYIGPLYVGGDIGTPDGEFSIQRFQVEEDGLITYGFSSAYAFAYTDPSRQFYIKYPNKSSPVIATVPRAGSENGEFTITNMTDEYLALGPQSGTGASGWCRTPAPIDGEPKPEDLVFRTLSGQPLSDVQWRRLNMFTRLHRRLGWSMADTDLALTAFDADFGKPEFIESLAALKKIVDLTGFALKDVTILASDITTDQYKSLFLTPSLVRTDPIFALTADGAPRFTISDAANPGKVETIEGHAVGIAAAFGVSTTEILAALPIVLPNDGNMTLKSLSTLFRYTVLCKILGQPLQQLSFLLGVYEGDPTVSIDEALRFIEFWRDLLSTYRTIPSEFYYIKTGKGDPASSVVNPDVIQQTARSIYEVLRVSAGTPAGDPKRKLDKIITILSSLFANLSPDAIALLLIRHPLGEINKSDEYLFVPPKTGLYTISGTPYGASMLVAKSALHGNTIILGKPGALSLIGGQFYKLRGTDPKLTDGNVTKEVPVDCLLDQTIIGKTGELLYTLQRYSTLFAAASIPPTDLESAVTVYDISVNAVLSKSDLEKFVHFDKLRSSFTSSKVLISVATQSYSSLQEAELALTAATQWDAKAVMDLFTGVLGLSSTAKSVQIGLSDLYTVFTALRMCDQVVHPAMLLKWANPSTKSADVAVEARAVARNKVDEKAWNKSAPALFDPIRLACRDALIAACLEMDRKLHDANGLFELLLIDVSMGSCLHTSRLKQALSSIQIFVRRWFLGLEAVSLTAEEAAEFSAQWEWKASYDTWLVNRKIFLYPENWLEPSLRDNKSQAFLAAEALLDKPTTSIQESMATLLSGLKEVSDLEVVSITSTPARDLYIARTRTIPHTFYYRHYDRSGSLWGLWEPIHVDIPTVSLKRTLKRPIPISTVLTQGKDGKIYSDESIANHLLPMVLGRYELGHLKNALRHYPNMAGNSGSYVYPVSVGGNDERLAVFLPTLKECSYQANSSSDPNSVRTFYYWEVGMSFTERIGGVWTPRQETQDTVNTRGRESQLRGDRSRNFTSFGVRDLDEHLVNQGLFFFTTFAESASRVGIRVYLAGWVCAQMLEPPDGAWRRFNAIYIGEFVLENGHCRLRSQREPLSDFGLTQYEKETLGMQFTQVPHLTDEKLNEGNVLDPVLDDDSRFWAPMPEKDWMFQACVERPEGQQIRTLKAPNVSSPWALQNTLQVVDVVPQASPSDDNALQHQWDKKSTAFCPTWKRPVPVPLSNNFVPALNDVILSKAPSDVITYFTDDPWPKLPDNASVDVMQLGLGLTDSITKTWYHELRTPIALDAWEACVHLPMALASGYMATQRLDKALEAVKLVFDPTTLEKGALAPGQHETAAEKDKRKAAVWRFLPFRQMASMSTTPKPGDADDFAEWARNPFNPFVVARSRHVAYMKWFAYKYIEILVAMGDAYFRRFTLESISLAIQSYVEAQELFGPAPQTIMSVGKKDGESYSTLRASASNKPDPSTGVDAFSDVLVHMETLFPFRLEAGEQTKINSPKVNIFGTSSARFFSVPPNPALVDLRNLIDDRLYKIRHCQDIDGTPRKLALWEKPLDPWAFVRAAANGVPVGSIYDGVTMKMPNYRFAFLLRKAFDVCAEVKALGATILSLRERKDADRLAILRLSQQKITGKRLLDTRRQELDEANAVLKVHERSRTAAAERMWFYLQLLGEDKSLIPAEGESFEGLAINIPKPVDDSGFPISNYEKKELDLSHKGMAFNTTAGVIDIAAGFIGAIPKIRLEEAPGGVGTSQEISGVELSSVAHGYSSLMRTLADNWRWKAENTGRLGQFEKQMQDRALQASTAGHEIVSHDLDIAAQRIRIDLAQARLDLEQLALDQDDEMDAFYRGQYTNTELYTWSINSLQRLYYDTYTLALETAMQAEKAFHFERGSVLGAGGQVFVQGGDWNSTRDGLYAGEHLTMALHGLEAAHMDNRAHDFELTRSVSLRQINPAALVSLRTTCSTGTFDLFEELWDMDFPNHANRRIRSVSVSIPCVVGPYMSLNANLTMQGSTKVRLRGGDLVEVEGAPITSIAVSSAQSDAGVFELNFHDERYMPFEGCGAIRYVVGLYRF